MLLESSISEDPTGELPFDTDLLLFELLHQELSDLRLLDTGLLHWELLLLELQHHELAHLEFCEELLLGVYRRLLVRYSQSSAWASRSGMLGLLADIHESSSFSCAPWDGYS